MHRKDFIHSYDGFWRTKEKCIVRVLNERNKPMVVICAQPKCYPGTSITNAAEFVIQSIHAVLAKELSNPLKKIYQSYFQGKLPSELITDVMNILERNGNKILKSCLACLRSVCLHIEDWIITKEKIRKIYWIQSYPHALGQDNHVNFIISISPQISELSFTPISLENISTITGYHHCDLLIDNSSLQLCAN